MGINLRGRSFLSLKTFSPQEISFLLDLAADLKIKKRLRIDAPTMRGRSIALIFEKHSTRTRCAFAVAAYDEGAHVEFLTNADTHLDGEEDIRDSARVLGRMFDGIEFRGFRHSTVEALAKWSGVPVWNGLTDDHHPTQILADMLTIRERMGSLKGRRLVFCGDARNNVANSLMIGCAKLGLHYVAAAPKDLFPREDLVEECRRFIKDEATEADISLVEDPREAVRGADVIYTDVWASMGEESIFEERSRVLMPYQVNSSLFAATGRDDTIFLHCLPAQRGHEVTEEVIEHSRSFVFDEAENRLHTIKAVMVATIGDI